MRSQHIRVAVKRVNNNRGNVLGFSEKKILLWWTFGFWTHGKTTRVTWEPVGQSDGSRYLGERNKLKQ